MENDIENKLGIKELSFALIVFIVLAISYTYPIFSNIQNWGAGDWDYVAFVNGVARITITEYKQFPLWNPYYFGGLPLLGNPQSQFLSPFFFFVIFFKEFIGFKIQILLHLIIGMLGIFFLSRHLGLGRVSRYLPSFVYFLSSIFAYNFVEGHFHYIAIAWVPWIFYFYLKAYENWKYVFLASGLLTLMFFQGSIYPFPHTVLLLGIFSFFNFIKSRSFKSIKLMAGVMIFLFLFSSIKLIPTMEFLSKYPRVRDASGGVELNGLNKMLLYSEHGWSRWGWLYKLFNFNNEGLVLWHEFTSYIGLAPLLLAILGVFLIFKKRWDLVFTTIAFLFLILGSKAPINLWGYLHYLPFYKYHQLPSRFNVIFTFLLAIFAGFASSKIEKFEIKKYKIPFITAVIILFIVFDLITLNNKMFLAAFVLPQQEIEKSPDFSQVLDNINYGAYSPMYPVLLANQGIIGGYEPISIPTNVKPTQKVNCSSYTDWLVFGPTSQEFDFTHINLSYEYIEDGTSIGWRLLKPNPLQLQEHMLCVVNFDFGSVFGVGKNAYLLNYVYVPTSRRVQTRFANDDKFMFWVNDRLIFAANSSFRLKEGFSAVFDLNQGWNKLLFLSANFDGNWFLTISDLTYPDNGGVLVDVAYSISKNEISLDIQRLPDKAPSEEVYTLGDGNAKINYFSSNKIKVDVDVNDISTLVLNQNYYPGWRTWQRLKVKNYNGLMAVEVPPAIKKVTFYYLPNSFLLGLFLSFFGIFLMLTMLRFNNTEMISNKTKEIILQGFSKIKEDLKTRGENEI